MKNQNLIQLQSGEEFKYINALTIDYVEFSPKKGKKAAAMLILFQSGEYQDLKGVWAEMMQRELEKVSAL